MSHIFFIYFTLSNKTKIINRCAIKQLNYKYIILTSDWTTGGQLFNFEK